MMSTTGQSSGIGIPCLAVNDIATSVDYYRDVVGFQVQVMLDTGQTRMALMQGYGTGILLQESSTQAANGCRPAPMTGPWDAVLLVADINVLFTHLRSNGADLLGEMTLAFGAHFFDFVDCVGNVICIGESAATPFGVAHTLRDRHTRTTLPNVIVEYSMLFRSAFRERQRAISERTHIREFRQFYESLSDKQDVYYMFFTSGLLHWMAAAEAHVPADTNLVLLGSALTDAERAWIADKLHRPFHHIGMPIDDITAWRFLFAVNRHNFGWLDIDCFVLNPALFAEMTKINRYVSMNCCWSLATNFGFPVAGTHLLFINKDVIRSVRSAGVATDPGTYDWTGSPLPQPQHGFSRVPGRRQRRLLLRVLPADASGRPRFISGAFYDTLHVYQLLARALGYPIHQVRDLARRCTLPADAESLDPAHWPEDLSDELFHLCGISYYDRYASNPAILALYLAAELIILDNMFGEHAAWPAEAYPQKRDKMVAKLAEFGMTATEARQRFRLHLINGRGVPETTADTVLSSGTRTDAPR